MKSIHSLITSNYTKSNLRKDRIATCIYCGNQKIAIEIQQFITEADGSNTAVCDECGIDSVVFTNTRVEGYDLFEKHHGRLFSGM